MVERCTMKVKAARSIPIAYGHERPITASHEGRKGRRSGRESQRNAETCVQIPARPSSLLFLHMGFRSLLAPPLGTLPYVGYGCVTSVTLPPARAKLR